jgi:hypothetical protein
MNLGFVSYWADELLESHCEAVHSALCILTDGYLYDPDDPVSHLAEFLSRHYRPCYDEGFLRRFFVTMLTLGKNLAHLTAVGSDSGQVFKD